ncbi:GAF domain-containing protein [Solwaraspora sp. WMMB335]|uniref:GAF domain-containing protein n=1 Tax=Solwaraspora sp. WMMB335 TaxID=3404118 RepID=UPI003B94840E
MLPGDYPYLDDARASRVRDDTGDDPARVAAVRRYRIVDRPHAEEHQRIAYLAAVLFDTPIATISLVEADRVWLAACHGLPGVTELSKDPGLCASVIRADDVYVVTDAATDPRTTTHPLVRGDLRLRFFAAAPIRTWDGFRLGTVNAIDRRPRRPGTKQLRALQHLAEVVADDLELRLIALRSTG